MKLLSVGLILLLTACSEKTNRTQSVNSVSISMGTITKTIAAKLGDEFKTEANTANTYLLAFKVKNAIETNSFYLVIDMRDGKVIKEGTFRPGYVKWADNYSIELLSVPGTIPIGKTMADYKTLLIIEHPKK